MKKALKILGWATLILVGGTVFIWAWVEDVKSVQYVFGFLVVGYFVGEGLRQHEERKQRQYDRLMERLWSIEQAIQRLNR